jgi:hypothetical protein
MPQDECQDLANRYRTFMAIGDTWYAAYWNYTIAHNTTAANNARRLATSNYNRAGVMAQIYDAAC